MTWAGTAVNATWYRLCRLPFFAFVLAGLCRLFHRFEARGGR